MLCANTALFIPCPCGGAELLLQVHAPGHATVRVGVQAAPASHAGPGHAPAGLPARAPPAEAPGARDHGAAGAARGQCAAALGARPAASWWLPAH